jgi:succinate dehydrogenase / fumarate reductase flavoprotein subunit
VRPLNVTGKLEANVKKIDNPSKEKIIELGRAVVSEKYGNLFDMYENIVGENPYDHAMKIYPAVHYTMGGLWVDYNLQTTVPGIYCLGEANFSDHGANRLGASALMQGSGRWLLRDPLHRGRLLWRTRSVPDRSRPSVRNS